MSRTDQDALIARCRARVGQTLGGRWSLTALIGVGSMAAVYAAVHRNGATSAIKLMHAEIAANSDARERFLREAYIANKVGHPGAVPVLDDDVDPDRIPYLVMELLAGESLAHRARQHGGRLPQAEVIALAEETLAVLDAAHSRGIIHRDIKPENLFLTHAGALKVLDFGIARLRESSSFRQATGMLLGTPAFMAPEQAAGRWSEVEPRTDLWAVGATMFTLLTGRLVHEGDTVNEALVTAATEPARSLARVLPTAPAALVHLVDRALAYDKAKRFPDAAAMRAELARLTPPPAVHASELPQSSPPPRIPTLIPPRSEAPHRSLTPSSREGWRTERTSVPPIWGPERPSAPPPRTDRRIDQSSVPPLWGAERQSVLPPRSERANMPPIWGPARPSAPPPRTERRIEQSSVPPLRGAERQSVLPPRSERTSMPPIWGPERPSAPPPRTERRIERQSVLPPRSDQRVERTSVPPSRDDDPTLPKRPSMLPPSDVAWRSNGRSRRSSVGPPRTDRPWRPSTVPPHDDSQRRPSVLPPRDEESAWRPSAVPFREESAWRPSAVPSIDNGQMRPSAMTAQEAGLHEHVAAFSAAESSRLPSQEAHPAANIDEVASMRELFALLEKLLLAELHHGSQHPEAARRFERLSSHAFSLLAALPNGLVWSVNPYSFFVGDQTLWEPQEPFNRVPHRLFSDGVRALALKPGLTEVELRSFLRIVALDTAKELAPEDDLVTMLWDACFDHVTYHAVDVFSEGHQLSRTQFERQRHDVMALALFDTGDALERCWTRSAAEHRGRLPAADEIAERANDLLERLAHQKLDADPDAAARARAEWVEQASERERPPPHALLRLDPKVRDGLTARMSPDPSAVGERFVLAAAHAYVEASRRDQAAAVTTPLRAAVDVLSREEPAAALHFVGSLCEAVDLDRRGDGAAVADGERAIQTEALRAALAGALVSPQTLSALLTGAQGAVPARGQEKEESADGYVDALARLLGHLDGSHVLAALDAARHIEAPRLRQILLDYVGRAGRGHEPAMGALFPVADVDLGLALVRLLTTLATPAAREAVSQAAHSPHPIVRIEALDQVEGVPSEQLRTEIRAVLEDRDPAVRLAALRSMGKYGIRVAGPFLVLRIRSSIFDGLPLEERREALETLRVLAPSRAEAIAIELLGETRFLSSEAHEQTRELAAELLGTVARSLEAVEALTEASKKRFRGNDRVRAAATRALVLATDRADPSKGQK